MEHSSAIIARRQICDDRFQSAGPSRDSVIVVGRRVSVDDLPRCSRDGSDACLVDALTILRRWERSFISAPAGRAQRVIPSKRTGAGRSGREVSRPRDSARGRDRGGRISVTPVKSTQDSGGPRSTPAVARRRSDRGVVSEVCARPMVSRRVETLAVGVRRRVVWSLGPPERQSTCST